MPILPQIYWLSMLSSSAGQTMYRYIKIPSLESLTSVSKSFFCLGVLSFNKLFQQIWRLINWRCLWFCPSLCFNGFVCLVNGQVNTRRQIFCNISCVLADSCCTPQWSSLWGGGSESSQVVFLQPQVLRRWGRLAPSETWLSALIGYCWPARAWNFCLWRVGRGVTSLCY